jgi:hypothetical protein
MNTSYIVILPLYKETNSYSLSNLSITFTEQDSYVHLGGNWFEFLLGSGCSDPGFSWFSSVLSGECWNFTLNYTTTASSYIFTKSLTIITLFYHIQCYVNEGS